MKKSVLFVLALFAAPLAAQNQDLSTPAPEGGEVETAFEDSGGGLVGSTTYESDWQDLTVAIPGFATDRDVPTPASNDGTAALGRDIARVITANLRNNGRYQPIGPDQ